MNRPPQQQPGASPLADAQAWFQSLPFVTRWLFALSVGTTLAGNVGLVHPFSLVLIPAKVWKLELWRLVTCFFFDKLGFNFAINLYFLYKNSLELESTLYAGRTADYAFFVLFQMACLAAAGAFMGWLVLFEGLIIAIIYLWAQYYRDRTVSFMFGFQFKAVYFPFVLLGWDFLTTGHVPYVKVAGILSAHLYYFLDRVLPEQQGGRRILQTPAFLAAAIPQDPAPRAAGFAAGGGVEAVRPRAAEAEPRQRHAWGTGHRLGE
ncbi:Der1-like family-domain-containing protein [Hyaloraphidium curvatum]|nr:Der1-like family-domain-containing protein [Hyaloraphidium curvatum]